MALTDDLEVLHQTPLFSEIPGEALRLLAFGATHRNIYEGQSLYKFGDSASGAYVVLSGNLELSAPNKNGEMAIVGTAERAALLGELALISPSKRQFTVTATENAHLMRFDRVLFHRLLTEYPEVADVLRKRIEQNITELTSNLQKIKYKFA
ncbi:cyclic nucleotide-binding domain-containing protein [Lentilitoribacter sp. EG35]|jgi:CRP-like cAMP-binding protein